MMLYGAKGQHQCLLSVNWTPNNTLHTHYITPPAWGQVNNQTKAEQLWIGPLGNEFQ